MYKQAIHFLKRFFTEAQIYKYGLNLSPMYRRTTAKIIEVSDDLHYVKIKISLNHKNRNYAGSIFGGSLFAATDPIYLIQLLQILGDDYVVWDKAACIKYKRPARETIYGEFIFSAEDIKRIKDDLENQNEIDIVKTMHLINNKSKIFAEVTKTVYVAKKEFYKEKLKRRKKTIKNTPIKFLIFKVFKIKIFK